jgi:lipoteichoic acid synthase
MKNKISHILTKIQNSPFLGRTLIVLYGIAMAIKQVIIYINYQHLFEKSSWTEALLYYLEYFVSDFLVLFFLIGFFAISFLINKKLIKIINNLIILSIVLLFVFDMFTIVIFKSRLSVRESMQFIWSWIHSFNATIFRVLGGSIVLLIALFFFVQSKIFTKYKNVLIALYLILFGLSYLWVMILSPNGIKSLPENVLSLNLSSRRQNIFTPWSVVVEKNPEEFSTYEDYFKQEKGQNTKKNIIIVFAESLSAIDSMRVAGVNNNLPNLDTMQKQGITYKNFISNGCTSDTAHISLLMGIEPLKNLSTNPSAYSGYKTPISTLPQSFNKNWYTTTFISSATLEFLEQRAFLSGVGFQKIIGEEAFVQNKKYSFDAAPDYDLYNKALEVIKEETNPYFLVMQNISLHKPYNTPYGKTEKDAIRYSDKMLYYFYLKLKKQKFFDNGILVIIGDHRKMEPVQEREKETLWEFWYTRSLATVIGSGIQPGMINPNIIQTTDFFYSLKQLAEPDLHTTSKLYNDVFSLQKQRDRGLVYCKYFSNNKYSIVSNNNTGTIFNSVSEITTSHPFIYKYISSYLTFQYGSWAIHYDDDDLILIAHQWSPNEAPENSLEGFLLAKKNGARVIELDVSFTKDKQNIVTHWPYMWWTTCRDTYYVYTNSFEKLKKQCPVKNGEELRTLEEMLKDIDGLFDYYFIDIKVYKEEDAEDTNIRHYRYREKIRNARQSSY